MVEGSLESSYVKFLVDSGAAVSVVDESILPQEARQRLRPSTSHTIGANGMPLDVVGRASLMVTLASFRQSHDFLIVRNLSVGCLLGADFLLQHGAIVDCTKRKLSLPGGEIPIISRLRPRNIDQSDPVTCIVAIAETVEVPGRTVQLISGKLTGGESWMEEGYRPNRSADLQWSAKTSRSCSCPRCCRSSHRGCPSGVEHCSRTVEALQGHPDRTVYPEEIHLSSR